MKNYVEKFYRLYPSILTFGFAYSAVIVFCLFGPVLDVLERKNSFELSVVAIVAFIVAFLIPYDLREYKKWLIAGFALSFSAFLAFPILVVRIMAIFLYAFLIATICKWWTYEVFEHIEVKIAGFVVGACFVIAFGILYLTNLFLPLLPLPVVWAIPLVLAGGAYFFSLRLSKFEVDAASVFTHHLDLKQIGRFALLILVYVCGGISYAGIYPFLVPYASIDRFYNVLPLVISLPLAGYITDRFGRRYAFAIGACGLSVAFVFFLLAHSVPIYFIIQTFLQIGWAFINVFGFSYAWHQSVDRGIPAYFGVGIVCILTGVMLGSVVAHVFFIRQVALAVYAVVTIIPLFACVLLYSMLIEAPKTVTVSISPLSKTDFFDLEILKDLTVREREVAFYYHQDESAPEIAERLHISVNTVRTHIKNTYFKLDISSKRELKSKIHQNSVKYGEN